MAEGTGDYVEGDYMHFTLHLTNQCNMACDYCYVNRDKPMTMTAETARKAVDMASFGNAAEMPSVGIIFFGGEPLTQKDLIYRTVEYCKDRERESGCLYHFKVTTNGMLLDESFLAFARDNNVFVAISHDGVREAHDLHRMDVNGNGTFELLSAKSDLLLSYQPYAPVLMTINPDNVQYYAKSVDYLFNRGFKYIICSMNYAGDWDESAIRELKKQYLELSKFYEERTLLEDKFYLSPFEVKISSHINRSSYCRERCELGKKQISVGPDGTLYPCVQFVGELKYAIGHVEQGIDEKKRNSLYQLNEKQKAECTGCAIKDRCNNHCGCMNKQATGNVDMVSPVLCAHERILMPIADSLAERLFKKRSALFIQKQYNDLYPLVSMIEDKTAESQKK